MIPPCEVVPAHRLSLEVAVEYQPKALGRGQRHPLEVLLDVQPAVDEPDAPTTSQSENHSRGYAHRASIDRPEAPVQLPAPDTAFDGQRSESRCAQTRTCISVVSDQDGPR